jgi:ubiquinone/menaquinone biosynthesis C-methylase UbiE
MQSKDYCKDHWEKVYNTKSTVDVSWYQPHAELSLVLIKATGVPKTAAIVDIGGGASTLVDDLLAEGYTNLHVLDISAAALAAAQQRLGQRALQVQWLVEDITQATLPPAVFDLWHDRAVFHFMTTQPQRDAYVATLQRTVKPGGHVILATFAEDGPEKCSGLSVQRYSVEGLQKELGAAFVLQSHYRESHRTPGGAEQQFIYCLFQKHG